MFFNVLTLVNAINKVYEFFIIAFLVKKTSFYKLQMRMKIKKNLHGFLL